MISLIEDLKQIYRFLRFRRRMNDRFPSAIGFEMTTRCNALCPMCVRRDYQIVNEDMDFSFLEKTVAEVAKWPRRQILFNLTGLSEPTLYPRLIESVAYVKQHIPESNVRIITNGIAMTSDLSKGLIHAGLNEMIISLNGANRDDYLALCGIDAYEKVTENIAALLENRRLLKSTTLRINLNLKRHESNTADIQNASSYWKPFFGNEDIVTISNVLPIRLDAPINRCGDILSRYPCGHLWGEIKLDIHGNLYPCDGKVMGYKYRENSELFLGNIRDISIKEAYLSSKVRDFRKIHLEGRFDILPTCQSCPSWSIFPNYWIRNEFFPFLKKMWL